MTVSAAVLNCMSDEEVLSFLAQGGTARGMVMRVRLIHEAALAELRHAELEVTRAGEWLCIATKVLRRIGG